MCIVSLRKYYETVHKVWTHVYPHLCPKKIKQYLLKNPTSQMGASVLVNADYWRFTLIYCTAVLLILFPRARVVLTHYIKHSPHATLLAGSGRSRRSPSLVQRKHIHQRFHCPIIELTFTCDVSCSATVNLLLDCYIILKDNTDLLAIVLKMLRNTERTGVSKRKTQTINKTTTYRDTTYWQHCW